MSDPHILAGLSALALVVGPTPFLRTINSLIGLKIGGMLPKGRGNLKTLAIFP